MACALLNGCKGSDSGESAYTSAPSLRSTNASKSSDIGNSGQPSPEALAERFIALLAAEDIESLKALRITKSEFCDLVWPALPGSRIPNVTCDWAWDQATLKSLSGLGEMWSMHKGKRYRLVSVRFAGGTELYPGYKVHNDTRVRVRDEQEREQELKLFGSMLEIGGRFKLFSFVID